MRACSRLVYLGFFAIVATVLGWSAPAAAADNVDEAMILVAKPALRDRLYGATVLVVKPIGNNQHMGFIVNKPTRMTLAKLFPDHVPSRKVTEPVYLGGPVNTEILFALVQRGDSPGKSSLQIAPDLFLAHERDVVDRIIETEADHARFFAGLVLWRPGELNAEIKQGYWYVQDANTELVLPKSTEGMWEGLVRELEIKAKAI